MSFVFSIKDSYRQAVEAQTGGKNTVIYDDVGNPSIMVRIPKFQLNDIFGGWPSDVHPAFIVNGVEKDEIFISKYQNIVHNGRAYSIPGQEPAVNIDFDDSYDACFAKGDGWHLMTNAEWAAIALWCLVNETQPRGNDDNTQSHEAAHERGVPTVQDSARQILTGTGPSTWNHDHTPVGIADLRGNAWEWVDGFKTIEGRIYVHPDNDFTVGNNAGDTTGWQDLQLYTDEIGGDIVINDERTSEIDDGVSPIETEFKDIDDTEGVTATDLMKYLAIFPPDDVSEIAGDNWWMRNEGERVPRRGGSRSAGSRAGVFAMFLSRVRSYSHVESGFRSAFVSLFSE